MKYKLAVIGSPIVHSFSPHIHCSFLEYIGAEYEYEKTEVKKGELEEYILYAKKNLCGFNVTMPHKQDIIPFMDEITEEAKRFNSVNTVKISNGKLIGYNTDADGYKMSLKEHGASFKGANIALLGAGGAASTIALKAALEGASSIIIFNRDKAKAEKIIDNIFSQTGFKALYSEFSYENLDKICKDTNLLINATPLGMHGFPGDFESFDFLHQLPKDAVVSDLIYNPEETNLLKNTKKEGKVAFNGLGMLIYQGLIADEIYTGKTFDYEAVKNIIANLF